MSGGGGGAASLTAQHSHGKMSISGGEKNFKVWISPQGSEFGSALKKGRVFLPKSGAPRAGGELRKVLAGSGASGSGSPGPLLCLRSSVFLVRRCY